MQYEIRPISVEQWLPDRCLRFKEPFKPSESQPAAGCERLQAVFSKGERSRLVALYEDILLRYGCCGFVAWQGEMVLGYNTFFPRNWSPTLPRGQADLISQGTLVHHCISIADSEKFREDEMAGEMIRRSLTWARDHGWERFEVSDVYHDKLPFANMIRRHYRSFWEKLGFQVERETDSGGRLDVIRSIGRWRGVEIHTDADADAFYPAWREQAVRYRMAIEL